MNNIKKFIIILCIILVILMATIVSIVIKLKSTDNAPIPEQNDNIKVTDVEVKNTLNRVTIRNDYYTVKNIVDQYYYALCNLNKTTEDIETFENDGSVGNLEEIVSQEKEVTKKRIYNFFDEKYISETGLTVNNIQEKLGNYKELDILIEDMYVRDITIDLKLYFISGTLTETATMKKEQFKLSVALDTNNYTYNIYTFEYAKKYKLEDTNSEYKIDEIKNRLYNKYKTKTVNDEEYAKELLKSYSQSVKYGNIDYSYNRLHENYKTNRFKDIKEYQKYIQENKTDIISSTLKYYKYNICEGYIQYICVDQNENYYIFNETATMNYGLILDVYTVDIPEFTEKYATAKNEEKVALNAQKIIAALSGKDASYLYNKLDTTFRNNKYPTINDLQKYIENNFFEKENIEFVELIQEGEIYIYKTKIKGESKESTFTIIMKLKEGTDFVFSFNIE